MTDKKQDETEESGKKKKDEKQRKSKGRHYEKGKREMQKQMILKKCNHNKQNNRIYVIWNEIKLTSPKNRDKKGKKKY